MRHNGRQHGGDVIDPMQIGMGFAYGAAGGIMLASFLHMNFLVMPLLIIGGGLGAAVMSGAFGDFGLGDFL